MQITKVILSVEDFYEIGIRICQIILFRKGFGANAERCRRIIAYAYCVFHFGYFPEGCHGDGPRC